MQLARAPRCVAQLPFRTIGGNLREKFAVDDSGAVEATCIVVGLIFTSSTRAGWERPQGDLDRLILGAAARVAGPSPPARSPSSDLTGSCFVTNAQ